MSTQDKKETITIPEEITKVIKIEILEELKKISAIPPSGSNTNYEEYKKKVLQQENLKK